MRALVDPAEALSDLAERCLRNLRSCATPGEIEEMIRVLYAVSPLLPEGIGREVEVVRSILEAHYELSNRGLCVYSFDEVYRYVMSWLRRLCVVGVYIGEFWRERRGGRLILGRCDPERGEGPSYLCVKDEEGKPLHIFEEWECLWDCPRVDAEEGCCHSRHAVVEILRDRVLIRRVGKFPMFRCGEEFVEVDELEIPPGGFVEVSLAGMRRSRRGRATTSYSRGCIKVEARGSFSCV